MSIKRTLKKDGKLFMRVFPTLPMTKKPSGLRMGKGKGSFHL
jgi:large subunit ribosomal protein L16